MVIEYDGTHYHGWQSQREVVTIQRTIEHTLQKILGESVRITGAGRTDAGVHALGQVANFRTKAGMDSHTLKKALNALLPKDIVIRRTEEVSPDFDSCIHAISKTYRYSILNREDRCAVGRYYCLHVSRPLNLEAMEEAATSLVGEHDFSSFRSSSSSSRNPVRQVIRAEFQREGEMIHFFIESNGFLHHMVRSIVGTLIEVGGGRLTPSDFRAILYARDRRLAGKTADPHGLCLMEVKYPEAEFVSNDRARKERISTH
jgi:tRNA pseudouridine38-40 synthase